MSSPRSPKPKNKWSKCEDADLSICVVAFGPGHWTTIARGVANRSPSQCYQRWLGLNTAKGPWQMEENDALKMAVAHHGNNWKLVADHVAAACPLLPPRSPKKCRDRWVGYLRPDINWDEFTDDESALLRHLVLTQRWRWVDIIHIYMPTRTVALLKKQCKKLNLRCCMSPGRRRSF